MFLDADATCDRILARLDEAADQGVELAAFGETFLPGYPFWLTHTDGARFDDPHQRAAYAAYVRAAVRLDGPQLCAIAERSRRRGVAVVLGVVEASPERHSSVYCTAVTIDPARGIVGAHRKLVPTWEERLAWTPGDGNGLRVHPLELSVPVRLSSLNCWENWMPQARFALWTQAPEVHVALWPGSPRLTGDITRFAAMEARCYVISASALLRPEDIGPGFPLREQLERLDASRKAETGSSTAYYSGGSAIAGPRGEWLVEPVAERAGLIVADLDLDAVARERHNLDVAGHYHRPELLQLHVDRRRHDTARFVDGPSAPAGGAPPPPGPPPPGPPPPPPPPPHPGDR